MYEYRAHIIKVVDGDTVDVDIDLGFGIVLSNERVRINGIDTPESRTRDKVEKKFGLAAKARLKSLLGKTCILKTQINKSGEDMKLFSRDSSLKNNVSLDEFKTTNVNILLNRVRIEKKNNFKKKIFFSFLMLVVISIISIVTISN